MRRLIPTERDERGVTLVLVAAFVVAMMVFAALVVDVGAMVAERRELQNGADAVALSIAQSCAQDEPACAASPGHSVLAELAGANAVDGVSTLEIVDVDTTAQTVTVRTRTESASGDDILPFSFAPAFGAKAGETLRATAVAAWGAPMNATAIPLGISVCEWEHAVLDTQTTTIFHTSQSSPCTAQSGSDIAGGFGWLDPAVGACELELTVGAETSAKSGASVPPGCDLSELLGEVLLLPVYDAITSTGTIARYHIVGFAAFELTGYRFPSTNSNPKPCNAPQTCVAGVFTHFVQHSGGPIGGGEFGVSIVKLVS